MVAVAAFVAVSHAFLAAPHLGKAAQDAMLAWRQRHVKLPDHDFGAGPVAADLLRTRE
jgi:hypothetical protein